MDELGVTARVGEPGDLEAEQSPGRGIGRAIGEGEAHALVIDESGSTLLAVHRPVERLLDEPLHRAHAARRDAQTLLHEPHPLEVIALPDAPDDVVVVDHDIGEEQRGMPVRVVVGEGHIGNRLDAGCVCGDGKERGQLLAVHLGVGHDDDDRSDGAEGNKPLLAVDDPAAIACRHRCRGHARGVTARIRLRHGVGIVQLPAQRGDEPALLLRGTRVLPDVVGVGDVPRDAIGRPTELLLDEEPLGDAPAVSAVLRRMRTTVYAVLHRLLADELLGFGG